VQLVGYILIKISVKFGIFPYLTKIAKVRPLFKKGDKLDIQNNRPITVPSVFYKILEKIMYHRLQGRFLLFL